MGRNGKKAPVFEQTVRFINLNVGKVVSSKEILFGEEPNRGAATAYLYKFIKLGYIKQVEGHSVMDPEALYVIEKALPVGYTSVKMKQELKDLNELS